MNDISVEKCLQFDRLSSIIKYSLSGEKGEDGMTVKDCYDLMGGGYEDVISRLMDDKRVVRFATRFLEDPSYGTLVDAMEKEDYETAFRASHTIKGVCQNLGFITLYQSSEALTEALRGGKNQDTKELEQQLKEDYERTVDAIKAMQETEAAQA